MCLRAICFLINSRGQHWAQRPRSLSGRGRSRRPSRRRRRSRLSSQGKMLHHAVRWGGFLFFRGQSWCFKRQTLGRVLCAGGGAKRRTSADAAKTMGVCRDGHDGIYRRWDRVGRRRTERCGGEGCGGGGYSYVACLSHLTIYHASLSRRSAVPTPDTNTLNVWALMALFSYIT